MSKIKTALLDSEWPDGPSSVDELELAEELLDYAMSLRELEEFVTLLGEHMAPKFDGDRCPSYRTDGLGQFALKLRELGYVDDTSDHALDEVRQMEDDLYAEDIARLEDDHAEDHAEDIARAEWSERGRRDLAEDIARALWSAPR